MFKRVSSSTSVRDRNSEEERDQDQEPDRSVALVVTTDRGASEYWAPAVTVAPWTIPSLVAPIPEVLECHRTVSELRSLVVATGVYEEAVEEVEEFEVKVEAKVEATVEAKAEAETADLDSPGDPRVERTTGEASD
ncbi:hypothetical protein EVAR_94777_1 [Eumeta japonica]|uniref:Uncharacterized protein n=1 Tax=Eumeta variegata TaxID=151549 RepID=A0A4C1UHZ6_EUMVA|nr:hypothetical protein EVAR_94777_1 [Eumeta japonica]